MSCSQRWSRAILLFAFLLLQVLACQPNHSELDNRTLLTLEPNVLFSRFSEGDLIELRDGRLAFVYTRFYGGQADHSSADLVIQISSDRGRTWQPERIVVSNEGGQNVMSVSLLRLPNDEILLFYLRKDSDTQCQLYVRRSDDELETQSEPVRVTLLPGYHVVNNDRVIQLRCGRLIVPANYHSDWPYRGEKDRIHDKGVPLVYFSDDWGKSWEQDRTPIKPVFERSVVLQENGVVERLDGTLLMFMRTDQGVQYQSVSRDRGLTWSAPTPGPIYSPLSPATIERNPLTGNLICIWNDHSGRHTFQPLRRTPLCLAVSTDDGLSWGDSRVLESDPKGWFCYTSLSFIGPDLVLSFSAGDSTLGLLSRLRVISVDQQSLEGDTLSVVRAKAQARRILKKALRQERNWIQIHAAEGLIAAGEDSLVVPIYLAMDRTTVGPELRIGVWRVLAQCSQLPEADRQHYRQRILDAFLDPGGPDRVHAGESAGKLAIRIDASVLDSIDLSDSDRRLPWAASWVQAVSGSPAGESRLMDLLLDADPAMRRLGSYALSWLPNLQTETMARLRQAAQNPLASAEEKAFHCAALYVHVEAAEKNKWSSVMQNMLPGSSVDVKKQFCHAAIRSHQASAPGFLLALIQDPDADTRVFAATALLVGVE
ncbi:exo-alpha-sialidase [candidate division KSB1 bacterium]|nr:exo-alpha-sialidase [candidate division KSB1 bacterium]